jgi:hypothetical protein
MVCVNSSVAIIPLIVVTNNARIKKNFFMTFCFIFPTKLEWINDPEKRKLTGRGKRGMSNNFWRRINMGILIISQKVNLEVNYHRLVNPIFHLITIFIKILLLIMSRKYKWGILAPGKMSAKFADGLKLLSNAELFAVGSRNLRRAKQFANKYGFKKFYGSYEEMAKKTWLCKERWQMGKS